MKKRIRYIFLLMSVCILGIIGFQAYWLYNAYDLAYHRFTGTINDALRDAVWQKGFKDAKDYVEMHPDLRQDKDSMNQRSWYFIAEKLKGEPYNLADLDSIYVQNLNDREVNATYVLDTMYRSDSNKKKFRRNHNRHSRLETRWIRANPAEHFFVKATFKTPYGYLFNKLFWVLVVSFLLLILTIGCFTYMINTILKQKKLSEIKNDFINNMTHELKTPIATVNAAIEALQHFHAMEDKEKASSYLEISHKELDRLSDLVEKVLQNSIEENVGFSITRQKVDVDKVIQDIIAQNELKTDKPVHFEYQNKLSGSIFKLDKVHFQNALNNIVDNAIKYSGQDVHIRIVVDSKPKNVLRISIKDDGIGISSTYKKMIFDKFFRIPKGDLHEVKGFGLGLSYVKNVIEKHQGSIEVESEPGKGSKFVIIIPVLEINTDKLN